jgi:hypothetical protein
MSMTSGAWARESEKDGKNYLLLSMRDGERRSSGLLLLEEIVQGAARVFGTP